MSSKAPPPTFVRWKAGDWDAYAWLKQQAAAEGLTVPQMVRVLIRRLAQGGGEVVAVSTPLPLSPPAASRVEADADAGEDAFDVWSFE